VYASIKPNPGENNYHRKMERPDKMIFKSSKNRPSFRSEYLYFQFFSDKGISISIKSIKFGNKEEIEAKMSKIEKL
jgi:hypothetical protein